MAAGQTYTPLATTRIAQNQYPSSITFSSIPSTYTDLILVYSGGVSSGREWGVQLNGDTANNYSYVYEQAQATTGTSTSAAADAFYIGALHGYNGILNGLDQMVIHIGNYSTTSTFTNIVSRTGTHIETRICAGYWKNTAVVNSITFLNPPGGSQTMFMGSTLTLYGIAAA